MKNLPKPSNTLKNVLNIIFVILIFAMAVNILGSGWLIFSPNANLPLSMAGIEITEWTPLIILLIILSITLKAGYLYTIFLFRKLIHLLSHNSLYTKLQSAILKLIGKLIIFLCLSDVLVTFLSTFILNNRVKFAIDVKFFDTFGFVICLGLFFIYLGEVFENARKIKEENDLTV